MGTFNLHHGAPPGHWYTRRGLARSTQRLGVDLLALQEVDRRVGRSRFSDQARIVARATGLRHVFAPARRLGPGGDYGIALLTSAPANAVEVLRLPSFGSEQRVALLASVDLGGHRVSVAATHLHNRPRIAKRQLPQVLERLMGRPGPHLLLGDLNAGPDVLGDAVAVAGLTAVVSPPTFPTRAPVQHLDWIAAGGLITSDVEVPPIWLSDHFPLLATIAFPDAIDPPHEPDIIS